MFGFLGFLLIIFLLIIFIGFTILGNILRVLFGMASIPPTRIEHLPTKNKIHMPRLKRMTRMKTLQNSLHLLQIDILIHRETEKKSLMTMRESM